MCSSALANFFIDKAKSENIAMTNLKLQKLMFIGFGWVYALTGKDTTDGEGFQAWQHGPVLPSIYHQMKRYGDAQINENASDYDSDENKIYIPSIQSEATLNILNKVWEIYKSFSAWSLRNLTHEKETPWDKVYNHSKMFNQINNDDVETYYLEYIGELLA